nr:hypothetical protein [Actinomycetales bacterium]
RIRQIFLNRVFLGTENVGPELSIAFSVAEMRNGQPGVVSENHRVYRALLEEVRGAQEEGALTRGTEAGTLTEGLLYAAVGIIQVWRLSGGELPAREIAERHIEAIVTLLRP